MQVKDKIIDTLITKILNVYPITKTEYGIRQYQGKFCVYSKSKHKTKSGRQYALFCRVHFGKHKK